MAPSPLPLEKPPITEALLDVQVSFPQVIDVERLRQLGETLQSEYPGVRPQLFAKVSFSPQPASLSTQSALNQGLRGYSFSSSDSKEVVQFRLDGFTFNRLAPYTSWEDMHGKARAAWRHYREAFADAKVTRIATRFINRIFIPLDKGEAELDDYFALGTKDPHDKNLVFANFFSHQGFLDLKTGFGANINTAMQPIENGRLPVILDIDVFEQRPEQLEANEPFSILAAMRDVKNRLFLKSLTPKALDLFK